MHRLYPERNEGRRIIFYNLNALKEVKNKMENKNETNEINTKLINASKLKKIFREVFDVFEKYNLGSGEIEFVVSDLKKLSRVYYKERIEKGE